MDKTQIAINTESFLDYLDNDADIRKALQAVKEIGYKSVELWHVKGPEHQASWRPFLDEAGLRCCAIHELYEEVMEHIDGTIAKAKGCGSRDSGHRKIPGYRLGGRGVHPEAGGRPE